MLATTSPANNFQRLRRIGATQLDRIEARLNEDQEYSLSATDLSAMREVRQIEQRIEEMERREAASSSEPVETHTALEAASEVEPVPTPDALKDSMASWTRHEQEAFEALALYVLDFYHEHGAFENADGPAPEIEPAALKKAKDFLTHNKRARKPENYSDQFIEAVRKLYQPVFEAFVHASQSGMKIPPAALVIAERAESWPAMRS